MKTITFFNNQGGVGKTSLVYHIAMMLADRGVTTLAVDLDPQSNLSSMFLDEDRLLEIWDETKGLSLFESLKPLINRTGDIGVAHVEKPHEKLGLLVGNLALSRFEDLLSENWSKCLDGKEDAFRVITAFLRIIERAAADLNAEIVLIDVGPNLGAINRSVLISAEKVAIPLAADLFSLQGLQNLGPTLREWRQGWKKRLNEKPQNSTISLPSGKMDPIGYIVMQHGTRDGRPVKAYQRWLDRIPEVYRTAVMDETPGKTPLPGNDPYELAQIRYFRSLMPLAMEARKPMFHLKPADGVIGSHVQSVQGCYTEFLALAKRVAASVGIGVS